LVFSVVILRAFISAYDFEPTHPAISRKRYRLRPRSPLSSLNREAVPGVSILRPLKGLDTNLYENLESTFIQEYPNFEIILSVADENDQALPIIKELMQKYPDVDAKVIVGEDFPMSRKQNSD
jgi:ceramide glucosyltransferase